MNKRISFVLINVLMLTGCSGAAPDLGVSNGRLAPCPKTPNCVNSQARDAGHAIEPVQFPGSLQEAKDRLLQVLKSEKRADIVSVEKNYIRAAFTSALFRFVDDVEFYFPEGQADKTIIHVRSASRVGRSDLGVNRKRIERIRKAL